MSYCTIRVELLDHATWDDYDNLHSQLEAENVFRKIEGDNGIWYDLPPATYHTTATYGGENIRVLVSRIAKGIDARARVIVTEGSSYWIGLKTSAYQLGPTMKAPAPPAYSLSGLFDTTPTRPTLLSGLTYLNPPKF